MPAAMCQNLDVNQFREVAGRLASIIQNSPDRTAALNRFVEAVSDADVFTDMVISYAGRWLAETSGQSVLIGPEMFWQLSSPDTRATGLVGDGGCADNGCGERSRKMLLVCVLEGLAQNHWHPSGVSEHRAPASMLTDPRLGAGGLLDHRMATNGVG
ncbi:hypothetical protein [Nocardia sp. alder85J]|uniref:hypothetical protein n=1 Tax=Nocardia sp. alder85J TaxID=2862949 RepID=UPI001CD67EA9|nr:hypothetical protein [Nocardia sp. alder85J]MCX4090842.1 hypothetical protein [Nocardia sp. alder85J]